MTMVVLCGAPAVAFAGDSGIKKDETVYVVTNSDGTQDDVIVSDHLVNGNEAKKISDETTLSDIENVKGDETFKQNGDSIEWAAKGKDIYYQGKTDQEVPIIMDINYRLDGQVVSGKELQGKSGDVEIRINYTNNGKFENKTIPFIVMTGLVVTDDSFTNVKVDHGKVIDDGDKQFVVGMAAPGLAQSLDIGENELGFGDSVMITGKAKKFNVEDMMTIVTNSVFEDIDTGDLDLDFDSQIKELNNGAKQLVSGSDLLYSSLDELAAQAPKLKEGTKKLKKGASDLKKGSDKTKQGSIDMKDGIGTLGSKLNESMTQMCQALTQISAGAGNLQSGLETLKGEITRESSDPTKFGMRQAIEKIAAATAGASTGIETASGYLGSAVNDLTNSDDGVIMYDAKALAELEGLMSAINEDSSIDDSTKANLVGQIEVIMNDINKSKNKLNDSENGVVKKIGTADAVLTTIDTEDKKNADLLAKTANQLAVGMLPEIDNLVDKLGSADQKGETLIYGAASIKAGSDQIISMIEESTTTGDLAKGLKQLNEGAGKLADGEKELNEGAKKLAAGTAELDEKAEGLVDGSRQLSEGSKKLNQGMKKLYNKGIKKIVYLYNNDLKGLTDGLDNVMDAGKGYKSFTKLPSNMDGSVKFIYKTKICD